MRNSTSQALGQNRRRLPNDSNFGLVFERFAPIELSPDRAGEIGKVPPELHRDNLAAFPGRDEFIRWLSDSVVPEIYSTAYDRWQAALRASGARIMRVRAESRLLVGHGNPSGLESGLQLNRTYGTPMIPGSSLKGILNHYLDAIGRASPDEAGWRGVGYEKGQPSEPPGRFHGAMFGAPGFPSRHKEPGPLRDGLRGAVRFEDSWYVPGSVAKVFAADVLTPHQKEYYDKRGGVDGPKDWDNPVPITFVSVRPGAEFLVAVTSANTEAADLALRLLGEALGERGIGSKTRAGYGRLRPVVEAEEKSAGLSRGERGRGQAAGGESTRTLPLPPAPQTEALKAIVAAVEFVLAPPPGTAAPAGERFDQRFGDDALLDALLTDAERLQARRVLDSMLDHKGLRKRRAGRLDQIKSRFGG